MNSEALSSLINIARQLLKSREAGLVDLAAIEEAVQAARTVVQTTWRTAFEPDEIQTAVKSLETLFVVEQGPSLSLVDRVRAPEWYVGDRRRPGPFMQRYLYKLEEGGWPVQSVDGLRESTASVLQVLDDPARAGPWDWRGLVVGDVQSGKTAHYAGVINRAADAGYRVIVVLAGMHNILRLQTQKRLGEDFLGYDTDPRSAVVNAPRRAIGVGTINPSLIVDTLTIAAPLGDFNQKVADQANFAPLSQPCLLVVKKNFRVLQNLNSWVRRLPAASRAAPLLVIDDEADQASVDTGDQPLLPDGTFDEDYDPKRVNGEIRKLLVAFERKAYVAYTATPFANILIHDERQAEGYGPDLFPSTFIVSLTPPDDYFGPVAVFGTNDGESDGLPLIRYVDQTQENWIPDVHDKRLIPRFDGKDVIPPSLERAIDAFLITCAARVARGQGTGHSSMLVHVSRFVDVHSIVHRQVEHYLLATRAMITGGDRDTLARLRAVWESDFAPTTDAVAPAVFGRLTTPVTWSQVAGCLPDSSEKIDVIIANGTVKTDIDYESYKETGRSLIAIGGDKLSRGLTLEGLSVSYFLRLSRQYDSLLQMGRWFGYRRGFADLCRLYTTSDMEDWFRHVATANKELRTQFVHMQLVDATPKDYGLRVEAHSIMEVTSANKQRHATVRQSSYAGEGKIQTVMFRNRAIIEQNAHLADAFIEHLGDGIKSPAGPGRKGLASGELWQNVPGGEVAGFLASLSFPPESLELDGKNLAAYIRDQVVHDELTGWTVFLPSADSRPVTLGGRTFGSIRRTPRGDRPAPDRYIVRTILSPFDESIDLSDVEFQDALAETNVDRQAVGEPLTDRPSGPSIRKVRGRRPQNGLLIIYALDPDIGIGPGVTDRPVIGVVVSFPESASALQRVYLINTVRRREEQA